MDENKKKSLFIKSIIFVAVFSIVVSFALYRAFRPKDLNHIVVINISSTTYKNITVNLSQQSLSQDFYWHEIEPLELRTENFKTLFAREAIITVSLGGKKISKEIDSVGRYGHSMVILLDGKNFYASYDSINRKE
jgi:flagellar basal body-associated protein FliL